MSLSTRVDVAIRGVRLDTAGVPVRRRAGAGPSDDGHVLLAGRGAALPLNPDSPYTISAGRLLLDGADLGLDADAVRRPAFYDLTTADGTSYEQLARLHGSGVLATTVVQTCIRYAPDTRCRFCAIEASLAAGSTVAVKRPEDLAAVAEAAVRLDGVTQVVMTTGTSAGRDRGARHVARCVAAVKAAVPGLPVQVQIEPPADSAAIAEALADLHGAGADSIGIHVESLDDAVRARWMPGKATTPLALYREAWAQAVRVFGRNQVSTYLLVGLGEDPDDLVAGAAELAEMGVYPFVVPFRPLAGTLAVDVDGVGAPDPGVVEDITRRVAAHLVSVGMLSSGQRAGCAACGACSALQAAGA